MKTNKKFLFAKAEKAFKKGTVAILCSILILLLAAGSCEQEKEKGIKYYDNVVGVGHVFLRYPNDSLVPRTNAKVIVRSSEKLDMGLGGIALGHTDSIYTNNYGQYVCRFVKNIDGTMMKEYAMRTPWYIFPPTAPEGYIFEKIKGVSCLVEDILNSSGIVYLDTIFYELHQYSK